MATQTDINNAVNQVINELTPQGRVAFPDGRYLGECTAPIVWYLKALGISALPAMFGSRADGWGVQFPTSLAPYFTHEAFQPSKAYPEGTILMWNSPHMAMVLSHDGSNTVKVFEQNADPDGAPCKIANRTINTATHTATYALVPILSAPPAPAAPAPAQLSYSVESIQPKQIQLKANPTHLWDLNRRDWADMSNHPADTLNAGTVVTVSALAHHVLGGSYYMPTAGVAQGYNIVDCEDYVAPAPTPVTVTPAPPVVKVTNITYTKLSAALSLVANKSTVDKWNLGFATYPEAKFVEQLAKGTSFVAFGKAQRTDLDHPVYFMNEADFGQADTTGSPANNFGINTVDLSPAPVATIIPAKSPDGLDVKVFPTLPTNWQETFRVEKTGNYIANTSTVVHDLSNPTQPALQLVKGQTVHVGGTFTKDGVEYYRTQKSVENDIWYGIPTIALAADELTEDKELLDPEFIHAMREDMGKLSTKEKTIKVAAIASAKRANFFSWFRHKK